jgi:hypothetical protein
MVLFLIGSFDFRFSNKGGMEIKFEAFLTSPMHGDRWVASPPKKYILPVGGDDVCKRRLWRRR